MPIPTAQLEAQQAIIATQMAVVALAVVTYETAAALQVSDPSAPHLAAQEAALADLVLQRSIAAGMVAVLPQILLETPGYCGPTQAGFISDLVYQVAYALSPIAS